MTIKSQVGLWARGKKVIYKYVHFNLSYIFSPRSNWSSSIHEPNNSEWDFTVTSCDFL